MDDEEFEFVIEFEQPRRRFLKTDVLVLGLDLLSGLAGAVSNTLEQARDVAVAHANWQVDQKRFEEEAVLQIEAITEGTEQDG